MNQALAGGADYTAPETDVLFGDVFEATFLRDVFVREDTALMGGGELAPNLATKFSKWIGHSLNSESPVGVYSPALAPKPETRFALAHATFVAPEESVRAIVISDSCLIATALVQGRQQRSVAGRLLFAPLSVVSKDKWQALSENPDFGRFPLPADKRLPEYSVIELDSCFMVDARDVKAHVDARIVSLSEPLAEALEVQWNAFATRRGPLAYERNTIKLASLLAGGGQPQEKQQFAVDAIADALDLAYRIEGADLEAVSTAEEEVRLAAGSVEQLTPPLKAELVSHLRELASLATDAADKLSAL
jgi:hypothetical protein